MNIVIIITVMTLFGTADDSVYFIISFNVNLTDTKEDLFSKAFCVLWLNRILILIIKFYMMKMI